MEETIRDVNKKLGSESVSYAASSDSQNVSGAHAIYEQSSDQLQAQNITFCQKLEHLESNSNREHHHLQYPTSGHTNKFKLSMEGLEWLVTSARVYSTLSLGISHSQTAN
jgi:hypothetical protein